MLVMLIVSIVMLFVFRMHFEEDSITKLKQAFAKQTNTFDAMAEYQTQVSLIRKLINKIKNIHIYGLMVSGLLYFEL